jgi:protein transport protein SEC24
MSVDLFITAENNINILTLNQLCEFTNGNLYFYKKFNFDLHYKNIFNQIKKVLSRPIIWEGINKIKFSNNCKINGFITPILIVENELFVFPTADADQNYIFNVGYDKQNENENNLKNKQIDNNINNLAMKKNFIYIQNSLLYSFGNGKRRIRVHNLCLPISNDPKIIYGSMNSEIIANYYIRMTIDKIYKSKTIANSISYTETQFRLFLNKVLHCLKQLPDNLSFLPYYMIGFFKNRLFFPNEIDKKYDIDLSNYLRIKFQKMYIKEALSYIIPMIYNINEIKKENKIGVYDKESGIFNLPNNLPCSKKELKEDGLYIIDIGYLLILYVRKKINKNILRNLFGVDEFNSINKNLNEDNVFEEINFFKERLMNIINYLRDEKSNFQNLIFVYEGTDSEKMINSYMIEDNNCKWYRVSYEKYYNKYIEDNSFGY